MPFIQFPFIEVPKELHKLVGEPTPGTRAYRREGSFKECGEWLEQLGEYYKGDVGLSTSSEGRDPTIAGEYWKLRRRCLRMGCKSVRKGTNRNEAPPVPEKNRGRIGKRPCKSMEREENHEKGPRGSWARNHMGNVS
jgi:hypothetical protein